MRINWFPVLLLRRAIIACLTLVLASVAAYADDSLDIVIYGASGEVGSHVVREALDRGHRVTAVSRNPQKVEMRHDNLSIVKGDLLDLSSITETVTGQDVVILSVRGVIGDSGLPENALQFIAAADRRVPDRWQPGIGRRSKRNRRRMCGSSSQLLTDRRSGLFSLSQL